MQVKRLAGLAVEKGESQLPVDLQKQTDKKKKWTRGGQRKGDKKVGEKATSLGVPTPSLSSVAKKRGRLEETEAAGALARDEAKRVRRGAEVMMQEGEKDSPMAGPADRSCMSQ